MKTDELEKIITQAVILSPIHAEELPGYDWRYFHNQLYQAIHRAVVSLMEQRQPVDALAIERWVRDNTQVRSMEVIALLESPYYRIESSLLPIWADLRDRRHRGKLARDLSAVIESADKDGGCLSSTISSAETVIDRVKLLSGDIDGVRTDAASCAVDASKFVDMAIQSRRRGDILDSGIEAVDKLIGGFFGDDYVVIGARPSVGKTAVSLEVVHQNCWTRHGTLFSLEMSREAIFCRLAARMCKINLSRIMKGYLDNEEQVRFNAAMGKLSHLKLSIYDTPMDVKQIGTMARREKRLHDTQFIAIDHFSLIRYQSKAETWQAKRQISQELVCLKKELRIPLFLLVQLSRDVAGKQRRPRMSDLRETGGIEEDADEVILLHQPLIDIGNGGYREKAEYLEFIIDKSRNGMTGMNVELFNRKYQTFGGEPLGPVIREEFDTGDAPF